MQSNALVRTVTADGRKLKRSKRTFSGTRKMSMSSGLRRYLNLRGTPDGVYEICRTAAITMPYTGSGWSIGVGQYVGATLWFTPNSINVSSGVAGNTATSNIPSASELSALFEKVKIDKVEVTISTSTQGQANTSVQQPIMYFAEDDNDTLTSPDQIKQMDCLEYIPGATDNNLKITIRPKYQRIVYYTNLVSSYEPTQGYVVTGTDIPHYGMKLGIEPNASGQINIICKVFYKLKGLK